jgi:hypothetical protein
MSWRRSWKRNNGRNARCGLRPPLRPHRRVTRLLPRLLFLLPPPCSSNGAFALWMIARSTRASSGKPRACICGLNASGLRAAANTRAWAIAAFCVSIRSRGISGRAPGAALIAVYSSAICGLVCGGKVDQRRLWFRCRDSCGEVWKIGEESTETQVNEETRRGGQWKAPARDGGIWQAPASSWANARPETIRHGLPSRLLPPARRK